MQKPDGLVILPIEELPCAILHLKLRDIPGIGPNMAERLQKAGITDIATLWKTDASMVAERTRLLLGKEVRGGCEHTTGGGGAADAQDRSGWPLSSSALTAEWIPAVEAEVGCVSFRSQSTTEHFCESRVLPRADRHGVARRRVPDVDKIFNIAAVEHDGERGSVRDRRNYRPFDTTLIRACSDPSADRHFIELHLRAILLLGNRTETASKILAAS